MLKMLTSLAFCKDKYFFLYKAIIFNLKIESYFNLLFISSVSQCIFLCEC